MHYSSILVYPYSSKKQKHKTKNNIKKKKKTWAPGITMTRES